MIRASRPGAWPVRRCWYRVPGGRHQGTGSARSSGSTRSGSLGRTRNAPEMRPSVSAEPCLHRLDEWSTALLAHAPALLGGLATDLVLNLVERGNLAQGFLGERRLSGGIDVIELASRMALMPSSA